MFEMFQYDFMQNAFIIWTIISILWPILWTFLIIKRYTLITDTLSHTSLTWIIIWLLSWISTVISTLFYSVISSIIIEKLRLSNKLSWDMTLALFLSLNLWLIAIIMSLNSWNFININSYFFWSIALVSRDETYLLLIIWLIITTILFSIRKILIKTIYDEDNALASWINTKIINIIFIVLVAMFITIALPITWILLLSALIILPVIWSVQISKSLKSTIIIAQIISFISMFLWISLSYFYDISASWITILLLIFFFCITFYFWQNSKNH